MLDLVVQCSRKKSHERTAVGVIDRGHHLNLCPFIAHAGFLPRENGIGGNVRDLKVVGKVSASNTFS